MQFAALATNQRTARAGKMAAAVEALLLPCHSDEDDGGGEFQPRLASCHAEDAGALQRDGYAAGIVVGTGCGIMGVEGICIARVIVAGDEDAAFRLCRIRATQECVDIGDLRWLQDAGGRAGLRRLDEVVPLYLQAASAGSRYSSKF